MYFPAVTHTSDRDCVLCIEKQRAFRLKITKRSHRLDLSLCAGHCDDIMIHTMHVREREPHLAFIIHAHSHKIAKHNRAPSKCIYLQHTALL